MKQIKRILVTLDKPNKNGITISSSCAEKLIEDYEKFKKSISFFPLVLHPENPRRFIHVGDFCGKVDKLEINKSNKLYMVAHCDTEFPAGKMLNCLLKEKAKLKFQADILACVDTKTKIASNCCLAGISVRYNYKVKTNEKEKR